MVADSGLPGKRIILSANTSVEATCDESFVERNNSRHEKSNHTWFGALNCCVDVDLLFQHTREHHDHHASNHGDYPTTTAADRHDNDHNDPSDGRRLLIGTPGTFNESLAVGGRGVSTRERFRRTVNSPLSTPSPCVCGRARWGDRKR